jgi:hypothetical protein
MNQMCRHRLTPSRRKRQLSSAEILRHARIVTDPEKLAYLKAEVEKRNARARAGCLGSRHAL